MLPRIKRLVVLVAVLAMVAPLSVPAQAGHIEPPFELKFPQETTKTQFSNDWHSSRSGGRRHAGNDLMATAKMVEVYAIADGVVTRINESRRPGRYVMIEHAGGWDSVYIHLNDDNIGTDDGKAPWALTVAPGVEVGATVEAGQLIGWVGDSGNAEGASPHTHFELHYLGRALNPYRYLAAAYRRDHAAILRLHQVLEVQTSGSIQIV